MGNENSESIPNKVSMIDTTVDNTGRSIKRFNIRKNLCVVSNV